MKNAKRLISLLLALAMIFALASCGKSNTDDKELSSDEEVVSGLGLTDNDDVTPDPDRKSTVNSDERLEYMKMAWSYVPTELGPVKYDDSGKHQIVATIFEQLIDKSSSGAEYVLRLAKDYKWEDDLNIVFEIYDYIYDSDGNHFTAADVVFSYDTIIAEKQLSSSSFIEKYEAISDYAVRFTFKKELDMSAFDDIFVKAWMFTEKAYKAHDMATDPVGTGPYKLTDYVSGAYAEITARDDYWQKEELITGLARANIQTLHIDFLSDKSMLLVALQDGTSAYGTLDGKSLSMFIDGGEYAEDFNVYNYSKETNTFAVVPNVGSSSMCNDINLRMAIFYALDTNAIIQALNADLFQSCSVNAPMSVVDYQDSWNDWENYMTTYDPDLAKEYLDKSNYKGETLKLTCDENSNKKTITLAIQSMLEEVGINVEINLVAKALLNPTLSDETAWDLYLVSEKGEYAITRLNTIYSSDYGIADGYPINFSTDEKLQEMLSECNTTKGYSIEKTEEIFQYLIDNAYDYSIGYEKVKATAYDLTFASIAEKWGSYKIIPTACDFYLD